MLFYGRVSVVFFSFSPPVALSAPLPVFWGMGWGGQLPRTLELKGERCALDKGESWGRRFMEALFNGRNINSIFLSAAWPFHTPSNVPSLIVVAVTFQLCGTLCAIFAR